MHNSDLSKGSVTPHRTMPLNVGKWQIFQSVLEFLVPFLFDQYISGEGINCFI